MDQSCISIRNVGKQFAARNQTIEALRDVNLEVEPNEFITFVGASGCGKSTTGRSIIKLVEPTRGSVKFEGQELTGLNPVQMRPLRRNMQMIFQDPYSSLNPRMTIGQIIEEGLIVNNIGSSGKDRNERGRDALVDAGLPGSITPRFPHEFSGGQRQRIAIARALVIRPKLIILDEAVSALDVSIRAQILDLLAELRDSHGLAYLFISHDLGVVTSITDRVMVMKDGKIVEHGPTADVMGAPAHGYTRELVAARPQIPPEWSQDRKAGR